MPTFLFVAIFAAVCAFAAAFYVTLYFQTKNEQVRKSIKSRGSINLGAATILALLYIIGVWEIGVWDETGFAINVLAVLMIFTYYPVKDISKVVKASCEVNTAT